MKSFSRPARLGAALALMLGGVATTALTSSGTANAGSPGCDPPRTNLTVTPGQSIWASDSIFCVAWYIPVPVSIYQDNTLVASGTGRADYFCQGTTVRHYRVEYTFANPTSFDAACG
ncbi:hypothetical protein [Catenulispora yoronensis]